MVKSDQVLRHNAFRATALFAVLQIAVLLCSCRKDESLPDEVNVKQFGARGDGTGDDAPAINAAIRAVYRNNGGTVYLPKGIYRLSSLSADGDGLKSYIVPKDHVSIRGDGMFSTKILIPADQNSRFPDENAPNVIATKQLRPLTNCRFADFSIEWISAGNALTAAAVRRNNAGILSFHGGRNIAVERVRVCGTPGNQCIFFPAQDDRSQGNITIKDCIFEDNGSGVSGSYNEDHTSVYLNGEGCKILSCVFTSSRPVLGTCFELHGSASMAANVYSSNYMRGFYFASDFKAVSNVSVKDSIFDSVWTAFDISAPVFAINNINVINSHFAQSADAKYAYGGSFINGTSPDSPCDNISIIGSSFKGHNLEHCRLMLLNMVKTVRIEGNYFTGFSEYGIWFGGSEISAKLFFEVVSIKNNTFLEVENPIYIRRTAAGFGCVSLVGNIFRRRSTAGVGPAINISAESGLVEVGRNLFSGYSAEVIDKAILRTQAIDN